MPEDGGGRRRRPGDGRRMESRTLHMQQAGGIDAAEARLVPQSHQSRELAAGRGEKGGLSAGNTISLGSGDHQVEMVRHEAEGVEFQVARRNDVRGELQTILMVPVVKIGGDASHAAGNDVVESAEEFDTNRHWKREQ